MEALRVGGLASGIDVNGIIQELVKARSGVLDQLKEKEDRLKIEKDVYKEISNMVNDLKDSLLKLRLQSTYLSKKVYSSNEGVITATASIDAAFGTHRVKVLQMATPAMASSMYARARLIDAGATGISSISGRPEETLEGTDSIEIYRDADTGKYFAVDRFSLKGKGSVDVYRGSVVEDSSNEGTIKSDVSKGSAISFTYGGKSITAYTGMDYTAGATSLYDVAEDLQDALNDAINQAMGTKDKTYVAVRVDTNVGAGNDALVVYDVEGLGLSFEDGDAVSALGLDAATHSTASYIESRVYADTLDDLSGRLGRLIRGVNFTVGDDGLAEGTVTIIRDATLNIKMPSPTYVYGGAGVSTGSGINLDATLDNAGFAKAPTESTNGYFTINGVKIEIDDYTKLTVRDLLAKINSSGAGVVAEYDAENDRFVLRSVENGADIRLGSFGDTSDFLSIAKLTVVEGAEKVEGSDGGKIDPTAPLSQTGMTVTPTSGTFTINGVSIYVDVTKDSLNDLIEKVNNSGAGVKMVYDSAMDKVIILSDPKNGGTNDAFIKLGSDSDTSNILYAFNLVPSTGSAFEVGKRGKDAVIEVDGITYTRPTNTIDDVIGGVTLNLNGVSDNYVTLSIKPDEDTIVDRFADFIAKYNALVKKLNPPELTDLEKQYLEPLSEEDKQSMTEDEIKEYEKKHKEYLSYQIISRSPELRSFLSQLRSTLFSMVEGLSPYNDLTDIGITTDFFGTYESQLKGYLLTESTDKDEIKDLLRQNDRFMDAVRNHTYDLYKLMAIDSDGKKGIARRLSDVVDSYFGVNGAVFTYIKPGGYLDRELRDLYKEMSSQQRMIASYEEELWQKFSMMDQMVARMQANYQYMLAQLGINPNQK